MPNATALPIGTIVRYHSPSWGWCTGRVLRDDLVDTRPDAGGCRQLCVLVQDLAPTGAREYWPRQELTILRLPEPTMPDAIVAYVAELLERDNADLVAAHLLAAAELALDAQRGRDWPHQPSALPFPERLMEIAELLRIPGITLASVDGDDAGSFGDHPRGAAFLAAWRTGAAVQWGTAPDPYTDDEADDLVTLLFADD